MSKWSEYYKSRVGDTYPIHCMFRYGPLIEAIEKHNPILILEEGCGIATITKLLAWRNPDRQYFAFDNDTEILDLAWYNLQNEKRGNHHPRHCNAACGNNIHLYEDEMIKDSSADGKYDVIFSHGVLEHMPDQVIRQVLERQRAEAYKVVHYVPTNGYDKPSFGDERLMSVNWWIRNWKPTRFEVFNDNKDLLLIWEQ